MKRLPDRLADFTDQGLLQSITKEDLEQTDLFVFRVSNGAFVSERKRLKPPTAIYQGSGVPTPATPSTTTCCCAARAIGRSLHPSIR